MRCVVIVVGIIDVVIVVASTIRCRLDLVSSFPAANVAGNQPPPPFLYCHCEPRQRRTGAAAVTPAAAEPRASRRRGRRRRIGRAVAFYARPGAQGAAGVGAGGGTGSKPRNEGFDPPPAPTLAAAHQGGHGSTVGRASARPGHREAGPTPPTCDEGAWGGRCGDKGPERQRGRGAPAARGLGFAERRDGRWSEAETDGPASPPLMPFSFPSLFPGGALAEPETVGP